MNGFIQLPWLTLLVLAPLGGALACMAWGRRAAVIAAMTEIAIALRLPLGQKPAVEAWIRFESWPWIKTYGARFSLGMDGLALLLIWLTVILMAVALGISWPRYRQGGYYALLLTSCSGTLGVFLARDLLLFYLCWEIMLLPLVLCIALWGEARRVEAGLKLLLFTLTGSLLMLFAFLTLYILHGRTTGDYTFAMQAILATPVAPELVPWLFGCLMVAFLIKVPAIPLQGWLPDAYQQAPLAVALLLAGALAKTGIFGLIRIVLPLFPDCWVGFAPFLAGIGLAGTIYGAWLAFVQDDLKRLIAYMSVAHLGFVLLGIAAGNELALQGSLLQLFSHGITISALFVLVAFVERRTTVRQLPELGGLWSRAPRLGALFLLFSLASLGLPGLNLFVGEILILMGAFLVRPWWGAVGMVGVLLAACYTLRMVQGVLWGACKGGEQPADLRHGEAALLIPLAILVLWTGLYPAPFMKLLDNPVRQIVLQLTSTGGLP
ncbi:complex I subunit 4 family protein [Syntrophotalea acetylenica]|uniref:NADH:quinone oxidoreductase/Mrp antiporter transmembrane domain-containing protein n=1 Tax=Syntrophotalea acetylenica TaxID=29542 RepID=A0A1L3GFY3_SYNAC|nr:NADH-quinone oxidoreductase subunit M [Syntrophotalea acetylenica]APG24588.1 hypothetical protein A7E75_05760 [Syntrophotalea acetylenica]